jgi:hypothetical protein
MLVIVRWLEHAQQTLAATRTRLGRHASAAS